MPKYAVPFFAYANSSIIIDVPDDVTDPTEIIRLASEKFHEDAPTLCHQCSGGYHGRLELEIGDEWEVPERDGSPDITRLLDGE